jgi:hypothetical protein
MMRGKRRHVRKKSEATARGRPPAVMRGRESTAVMRADEGRVTGEGEVVWSCPSEARGLGVRRERG